MQSTRLLIAAGVGLLCAAAPAGADSIAYIKDNNIWLARPDGTGQVQVTHDGTATMPYRSPSQADNGTIAAGHGGDLVTLAQSGQPLAQFTPPIATDSTGQIVSDVPQQAAISPNAQMIAYVYSQPSCPPSAPCGVRQVMLYSAADHTTPVSTYGEQTNLTNPTWIDNSRVLAFGGHFHQVNVDSPGGGNDDAGYWFDDPGNEDIGDGELSRQGDRLALVRSYGPGTHMAIYHVSGGVGGATPVAACFTGTDASLSGPSWSPDGTKLAFADSQGIEVMPIPSVVDGDCPGAASSAVVLPGATAPDWGPADIRHDAGTWTATHVRPFPPPPPRLSVSAPRQVRFAALARAGLLIRARASARGRLRATAVLGRRTLASARVTTDGRQTATIRLSFTRTTLRSLRRSRATRLAVTVILTPATGHRIARTVRIRATR
ncbi:MAG: hypothetical protein ACXVUE_07240 [Solirubrobacteraceae bacterium]